VYVQSVPARGAGERGIQVVQTRGFKKAFRTSATEKTPLLTKRPASPEMPICSETFEKPIYPNISTPSRPLAPPTPLKTLVSPHEHPLNYSKGPFDDLSDYYKQNIFKGMPRKWRVTHRVAIESLLLRSFTVQSEFSMWRYNA
jgi:hypothetical protein